MNQLDVDYQNLLKDILDNGVSKNDRTGTGTLSVFGRQIRHSMSNGFPLLTTKKMAWKTIVTELLWFLRGDTNIKFLLDYDCHIWDGDAYKNYVNKTNEDIFKSDITLPPSYYPMYKDKFINKIKTDDEFAKEWGELGPIYGKQWRDWNGKPEQITNYGGGEINPYFCDCQELFEDGHSKVRKKNKGIDQIANLISELKTNPDSRRLIVSAWNCSDLDSMVLPPCHYGFQLYTRELSESERVKVLHERYGNRGSHIENGFDVLDELNIPTRAISLMWNQRSVDTALGLPMNIASYALLLLMIADEVNMVPDQLIGNLGDVHLYSDHLEGAKEQITRTPYELPKVNINTEWWDKPFFEAVKSDNFCKCLLEEDIQLYNYQSHPKIYFPLSN
jgi:thymidylate synthase